MQSFQGSPNNYLITESLIYIFFIAVIGSPILINTLFFGPPFWLTDDLAILSA